MKILALKFKNLNSLKGEWVIDFGDPELTRDGVFAITGPTGAGKSTILDAICLAMYGMTPRSPTPSLSGVAQSVSAGRETAYAKAVVELEGRVYLCECLLAFKSKTAAAAKRKAKAAAGSVSLSPLEASDSPSQSEAKREPDPAEGADSAAGSDLGFDSQPAADSARSSDASAPAPELKRTLAAHDVTGLAGDGASGFWGKLKALRPGEPMSRWALFLAREAAAGKAARSLGLMAKVEDYRGWARDALRIEFGQFLRSAMLAQGEFGRFLDSAPKDKADLLKKITRRDEYGAIGAGVFALAKEASERAGLCQGRADAARVMDPLERAQLESRLAQVGDKLGRARLELAQTQKLAAQRKDYLAWKELDQAARAQSDAVAAREAKWDAQTKGALQRAIAARALQPLGQAAQEAAKAALGAQKDAAAAQEAARQAQSAAAASKDAAQAAKQALEAAQGAKERADRAIGALAAIDAAIEKTGQEALGAQARAQEARAKLDALRRDNESLGQRLAAGQARLKALRDAMSARAAEAKAPELAAQAQELARGLAQSLDAASASCGFAAQALAEWSRARSDWASAQDRARGAVELLGELRLEAQGLKKRRDQALGGGGKARSARIARAAWQTADALETWGRLRQDAKNAMEKRRLREADAERISEEIQKWAGRVGGLDSAQADLERKRKELDALRSQCMAQEASVRLLTDLRPGEPCPVCGAPCSDSRALSKRGAEERAKLGRLEARLKAGEESFGADWARAQLERQGAEQGMARLEGAEKGAKEDLDRLRKDSGAALKRLATAAKKACAAAQSLADAMGADGVGERPCGKEEDREASREARPDARPEAARGDGAAFADAGNSGRLWAKWARRQSQAAMGFELGLADDALGAPDPDDLFCAPDASGAPVGLEELAAAAAQEARAFDGACALADDADAQLERIEGRWAQIELEAEAAKDREHSAFVASEQAKSEFAARREGLSRALLSAQSAARRLEETAVSCLSAPQDAADRLRRALGFGERGADGGADLTPAGWPDALDRLAQAARDGARPGASGESGSSDGAKDAAADWPPRVLTEGGRGDALSRAVEAAQFLAGRVADAAAARRRDEGEERRLQAELEKGEVERRFLAQAQSDAQKDAAAKQAEGDRAQAELSRALAERRTRARALGPLLGAGLKELAGDEPTAKLESLFRLRADRARLAAEEAQRAANEADRLAERQSARARAAADQAQAAAADKDLADKRLGEGASAAGFGSEADWRLALGDAPRIAQWTAQREELALARSKADSLAEQARAGKTKLAPDAENGEALEVLQARERQAQEDLMALSRESGALGRALQDDAEKARLKAELQAKADAAARERDDWQTLNGLIGSAEGDRFNLMGMQNIFEALVGHANRYLRRMMGRYELFVDAGAKPAKGEQGFSLSVMDRYQDRRARSCANLSGGERFVASLALALGMIDMGGKKSGASISSVFLDEGFGALDGESLNDALECLSAVSGKGRLLGVISHVEQVKEHFPSRIAVSKSGGRSALQGPGCHRLS